MRMKVIAGLSAILIVIACSACGKNTTDSRSDRLSSKTLWQVLDETGNVEIYLEDDDPDVVQISNLVRNHISWVDNRSANNVHFLEESQLYSTDFIESLNISGYETKLEAMYSENNLEVTSISIIWNPNTVNQQRTSCKVDIDSVFQFVSATDDYLNQMEIELNCNYKEHRIYYCEKNEGVWVITNIEKSALYQ